MHKWLPLVIQLWFFSYHVTTRQEPGGAKVQAYLELDLAPPSQDVGMKPCGVKVRSLDARMGPGTLPSQGRGRRIWCPPSPGTALH